MAKAKKKAPAKKAAPKKQNVKKKSAPKKAAKKPAPKKAPAKKTAKKAAPKAARKSVKPAPAKSLPAKAPRSPGPSMDLSDFVTPLDDRLIVRLKEAERKTAGGLFIPDTVADVSGNLEGTVVAVGRGHRDKKGRVRPMDVKAGDRVIFSEYSGSKIRLKDEDFVILREGDLSGVLS